MNKVMVASLFGISAISVGVLCATGSPVAYGVGEATPPVVGVGVVSLLTALMSGAGGLFALFRGQGGGALKTVEDMLGGMIGTKQTIETITAEIALVALAGLCIKAGDTANLTKIGELSASMLGKKA